MKHGDDWWKNCRGAGGSGEESHKTTSDLSMACFGFYEQAHPGVICRWIMADGKNTHRRFSVGEIRAVWEKLLKTLFEELELK